MERLIRIDKNGTKYFENTTCPKCCGRGYIDCYAHVEGGVCFQCGGSGYYLTHRKVLTPEYEAKLEARREAKRERKIAEFNANIAEHYKKLGLNVEGHCFAVLDKTFGRKDELKAAGARFNGDWWYFDEPKEGWDTAEIDATKFVYKHELDGVIGWDERFKGFELKEEVQSILRKRREQINASRNTEFFGNVGDKVTKAVTLEKVFSFEATDFRGEDCTMYGFKMNDGEGHRFVWLTACDPWRVLGIEEDVPGCVCHYSREEYEAFYGKQFNLRGTVKGHKERESLKETQLTRCKIQKVAV